MTAGVGLFGTLSGFLAQAFLSPPKAAPAAAEVSDDPKERVASLLRQIEEHEQAATELRKQLNEVISAL